jgi:predicted XRE-type DNA-binding protein
MRSTHNQDVREAIRAAGLFGYQVAAAIGISETSFSRALARGELSQARKEKIMEVCKHAEVTGAE